MLTDAGFIAYAATRGDRAAARLVHHAAVLPAIRLLGLHPEAPR
jgi:hypothetical protein